MKGILIGLTLLFGFCTCSKADPVTPIAYEYINNLYPYGPPKFLDTTGFKLTDGLYGGFVPGVVISSADPNNWVEFGGAGEVQFHFASSVTITNIVLSMLRWEPAAIYLPDQLKVNEVDYSGYAGTFNDMDRALISLDGAWTGSDLTIRFSHSQYLFMDEVSFSSLVEPVPEPSILAQVSLAAPLLLFSRRASKKSLRG
jgi:hypothetical protein